MTKILIEEATAKLALEALETSPMSRKNKDAIDALRSALAERPAPRVVDCHATGVCVQSGLWAEPPTGAGVS